MFDRFFNIIIKKSYLNLKFLFFYLLNKFNNLNNYLDKKIKVYVIMQTSKFINYINFKNY